MRKHNLNTLDVLKVSNNMTSEDITLIQPLYLLYGEMPQQDPVFISSLIEHKFKGESHVYIFPRNNPILVLGLKKRDEDTWESIIPRGPLLFNEELLTGELLYLVLNFILKDLDAKTLYFPLNYKWTKCFKILKEIKDIDSWERSSAQAISWEDQGISLVDRFISNKGSQAKRKMKKWDGNLKLNHVYEPIEATNIIKEIELKSWKFNAGYDLVTSNQIEFYRMLLTNNLASVTTAIYNNKEIAYFVDIIKSDVAYILEWSFNDEYGYLSPGYFLLTKGILEKYNKRKIKYIDLYGANDTLKESIKNSELCRIDFAWPKSQITANIKLERINHDDVLDSSLRGNIGLRNVYK